MQCLLECGPIARGMAHNNIPDPIRRADHDPARLPVDLLRPYPAEQMMVLR
jgi:hypothetical protein